MGDTDHVTHIGGCNIHEPRCDDRIERIFGERRFESVGQHEMKTVFVAVAALKGPRYMFALRDISGVRGQLPDFFDVADLVELRVALAKGNRSAPNHDVSHSEQERIEIDDDCFGVAAASMQIVCEPARTSPEYQRAPGRLPLEGV